MAKPFPVGLGGTNKRHSADYDTHTKTLWNFSTFGACAYSEKRSTPIFLAAEQFLEGPERHDAYAALQRRLRLESWMNPSLLQDPVS